MSEPAIDLSNALAARVEAVGPLVVRVEGRRRLPASGVVWSADGVIVAAHHAVERDEDVAVVLSDGRSLAATVAGRDPGTDLAVLKVAASGLARADGSALDGLKVGHLVLALARPGKTARAAMGVVAALGTEPWRTPWGGRVERYLETDIDLPPGFSGGALVDLSGRVLGVNTSALVRRASIAVPTATVSRVVESVLAHGGVRRGFLGVGVYPVRLTADLERRVGRPWALLVISVQPQSPAERAGVLIGDVLASLDDQSLSRFEDLFALLDDDRVGKEVTLEIARAGELRHLKVTLGTRG